MIVEIAMQPNPIIQFLSRAQTFYGIEIPDVVVGIIFVIAFVWIVAAAILIWRTAEVFNDLGSCARLFKDFKGFLTGAEVESIREGMAKIPRLKDSWAEFEECLIEDRAQDGKNYLFNTYQSHEFFGLENLVDHRVQVASLGAVPGILTSIGLLGTFLALFCGLVNLHVVESGQVQGIDILINNLAGKFLSSITGLLAAVSFVFLEKGFVAKLRSNCLALQSRIDRLFKRKTEADLLKSIRDSIEKQSDAFRVFNTDLSGYMKESFRESMAPMMDRMVTAIENLQTETEMLRKQKEQSSSQAIGDMLGEFQKSLTQSANSEFTRLSEVLTDTSKFTEGMNNRMETFLSTVDGILSSQSERSKAQSEALENSVGSMLEKLEAGSANQMKAFEQGFEGVIGQVQRWSVDSTNTLDRLVQKASEKEEHMQLLSNSIKETALALGETLERNKGVSNELREVSLVLQGASRTVAESGNQLTDATSETGKAVSQLTDGIKVQNDALSSVREVWSQQDQLYRVLDEKLSSSVGVLSEAFSEYSQNTSDKLAGYLNDFDKSLADACRKLSVTVSELDDQLEGLTGAIDGRLDDLVKAK